jgi:hypothetical protein
VPPATGPAAPEVAELDPTGLVATTMTRTVEPASALFSEYEALVAPEIWLHESPDELQRAHWYP